MFWGKYYGESLGFFFSPWGGYLPVQCAVQDLSSMKTDKRNNILEFWRKLIPINFLPLKIVFLLLNVFSIMLIDREPTAPILNVTL